MPVATLRDGAIISAMALGSSIMLIANAKTTMVTNGYDVAVAGHTIAASGTNATIVDGASTLPLQPVDKTKTNAAATATDALPSSTVPLPPISIAQLSQAIVLNEGSSIATLSVGAETTFAGHTVGVSRSSAGIVFVDGATMSPADATLPSVETGQPLLVQDTSGILVATQDGSAITLRPGEQTIFAGHTVIAVAGGSAIMIDGQSTLTAERGSTAAIASQGNLPSVPADGTRSLAVPGASSTTADSSMARTLPVFDIWAAVGFMLFSIAL